MSAQGKTVTDNHAADAGPRIKGEAQSHLTVEEFARRTGMSARNIRALQGRGLLPPPVRRGRRAFYLEQHVQRAAAIRDLQRQGFNLFAIGAILGTREADPQAAELAGVLRRLDSRDPGLVATLERHGIVARSARGELRVTRSKPVLTALTLRQLGVPLQAAIRILADVLNAAEPASGELVRLVHTEMVDTWDPDRGPALSSHPMTRIQAVITLLSEATRVVLENAGAELVREALGAGSSAVAGD